MPDKTKINWEAETPTHSIDLGVASGFDLTKKPKPREASIEKYLTNKIKSIGGKCYKFVSPGYSGMPDRIAVCSGFVMFIEVKRPGAKPRKLQSDRHLELQKLGAETATVSTKEEVNRVVNYIITKGHYNVKKL